MSPILYSGSEDVLVRIDNNMATFVIEMQKVIETMDTDYKFFNPIIELSSEITKLIDTYSIDEDSSREELRKLTVKVGVLAMLMRGYK